jgi:hypothetical protein
VDLDVTLSLLIIYSAFVKCLRKNENVIKQYISYLLVEHKNALLLKLTLVVAFTVGGRVEHSYAFVDL